MRLLFEVCRPHIESIGIGAYSLVQALNCSGPSNIQWLLRNRLILKDLHTLILQLFTSGHTTDLLAPYLTQLPSLRTIERARDDGKGRNVLATSHINATITTADSLDILLHPLRYKYAVSYTWDLVFFATYTI